ncbi:MAG TPA: hypothetical protein VFS59_03870 [Gemmatimonadaceae bacterium]|nr:hypothetical protein [Gemmatimonadaceae bacterium]
MPAPFQQPAPPAQPAQPAPPAPAPNVVYAGSLPGGTMTRQELADLRARRSELSDQLESAASRRRQLAEQLRRADGANKAGLDARIAVLDQRIIRLESELDETGQVLASPQAARLIAQTRPPMNFSPPVRFNNVDPEPILITFTLFVLAPISLAMSRLIWKRASRVGMRAPAIAGDSSERLERIEQAMDAIAIEVERVSEGQRFVTRLLSERGGASLGVAQSAAEPVRVPVGEASRVR